MRSKRSVQSDGGAFADHLDVKAVPLTDGFVHELERVLAFGVLVVPETARAKRLAERDGFLILLCKIPDLHLRYATEVNAAITEREHFVIDHEFKVAVVLVSREVEAFTVIHEFAVFDLPVGIDVVALVIAFGVFETAFDGFLFVLRLLLSGHFPEVGRILGAPAIPAGEVFTIKQRRQAFRRGIVFSRSRGGEAMDLRGLAGAFDDSAGTNARRLAPPRPVRAAAAPLPFPYLQPAAGSIVEGFEDMSRVGVRARGITLATRKGAQVVAPAKGRIAYAGPFRTYGDIVIVQHPGRLLSMMSGLERVDVLVGETVSAGTPIVRMGSLEPELYLELRQSGRPIDPAPHVRKTGRDG